MYDSRLLPVTSRASRNVGRQTELMTNITVTGTPFGDERRMHMGAKDGKGEWGIGHTDDADVTLTDVREQIDDQEERLTAAGVRLELGRQRLPDGATDAPEARKRPG